MTCMRFVKVASVAAMLTVGALGAASAASLDGVTIRATANFPTIGGGTTGGPVDAVVGPGVEFVDGDFGSFFGPSFDFAGDLLTITHAQTSHSSGTFNGYIFNDLNNALNDFNAFSIVSDSTGFFSSDPSRIFFDADNLFVNFESLSFAGTNNPTIQLRIGNAGDTSVIPLPATLPLLLAGFGVLVGARKLRRS